MSSEIAIKVENLSKCYQIYDHAQDRLKQLLFPRLHRWVGRQPKRYFGEFWALRDISLEIKKGETVGIIGRNGSGKSTLLQLICGTLNPTSGSIHCNGRIAALLELGSGFNPEFTGRENVYLNAAVLGLNREEISARYDEIVAFADIPDFMDQPVKTYSSGMVVRLAFAVAINTDPEILIVDEALSVGDELFQRKCFSRIEAIKSKGATILFVSHSGSTIVELCDRAVLLEASAKLAVGNPKTIVGIYQKLLYAPKEKQEQFRSQIPQLVAAADSQKAPKGGAVAEDEGDGDEYFDPYLKPDSTLEFMPSGALISNPSITTLSGRLVNNLKSRRQYCYTYQVTFDQAVRNVRFGMVIKTISGFSLGGAHSERMENAIPWVPAGKTVNVTFHFDCRLNPGMYFMNAGAFGVIDQEEVLLHRIVDVIVFRVIPPEYNLATELVDFNCVASVQIDE